MIPQPPPGQGPIDPRAAFSAGNQGGAPAPQAGPSVFAPGIGNPAAMQQQMGLPPSYAPQQMPQMPPMYPPPGMMPPGMMPPPYGPPRPRSGGVLRAMFTTLLIIVLLISVLINFVSFGSSGLTSSAGIIQQTIKAGSSDEKVVVIPLEGVIAEQMADRFSQFLDLAEKDKNVKAVVIAIDTPGGTVTASDEIYDRITRFKAAKKVPVIVTMGGMATSGGYYAACAGDYIFAQPTTLTGNIGVIMPRYNYSGLMEKYGVQETTIVSSGATFKNATSSTSPESAEGKAYLQNLMDSAFGRFKSVVSTGRGSKLTGKIDDIANGMAYTADEALGHGLIDQKGYAEDAYQYAVKGMSNPTIVRYSPPPQSILSLLMKSGVEGASAKSGGITINIDEKFLSEFTTPRPLYMWRGQ